MKHRIIRSKLNTRQQNYVISKIEDLTYTGVSWEGRHTAIRYNEDNEDINPLVFKAVTAIIDILEIEQNFNTVTIRKLEVGDYVIPHIDSRNTVGESVTLVMGNFESCQYKFDETVEEIRPGDIIVQQCTNGYSMGPKYCMYPMKDGTQYAITISTILRENPV